MSSARSQFDSLPSELHARLATLEAENERLRRDLSRSGPPEATLAALVHASPLPIVALTAEGVVTLWNRAAEQVFGWTAEETIGRELPFIPAEKRTEHRAMRQQDLAGEGFVGREIRRLRKDGRLIDLSVSTAPVCDETGRVTGIMSVYQDITERRRATEQLAQLNQDLARRVAEFETLLNVVPAGVVMAMDADCKQVRVNQAFANWAGIPVEENASRTDGPRAENVPYQMIRNGCVLSTQEMPLRRAIREGKPLEYDVDLVREDGQRISLYGHVAPILDERGTPRGSVLALVDVTERQRLLAREQEARHTAELLNRVGPILAAELDQQRLVQAITDIAAQLMGAEVASFYDRPPDAKNDPYQLDQLSGVAYEPLRTQMSLVGAVLRGEAPVLRLDDDSSVVPSSEPTALLVRSYLAASVVSRTGEVHGALLFGHSQPGRFTDQHQQIVQGIAAQAAVALDNARLFEQVRCERERVEQARQELEQTNAELERFVYVASHDLQEPLRTVSSYVQLLARQYRGRLSEDADEFIGYATSGIARMQALIRDLLTYSRVGYRTSGLEAQLNPVPLGEVLDHVLAGLRSVLDESEAAVTHDALPTVLGDGIQLAQLLQNLIGNAIKYGRPGIPPRVSVRVEELPNEWQFSVADNGAGFPAEQSEKIFGLFKRLHGPEIPGTGIGLAICQRIVERHGGRIWAQGQPNAGATFFFTLPRCPAG